MQAILLPHSDFKNREWLNDLGFSLIGHFDSISLHRYDHWNNKELDVSSEVKHIRSKFKDSVVIGMDAGAILAIEAADHSMRPAGLVLLNLKSSTHEKKAKWLARDVPTLNLKAVNLEKDRGKIVSKIRNFLIKLENKKA